MTAQALFLDKGIQVLDIRHPDFAGGATGGSDDTDAIQAALDYGEHVYVPAGTWNVSTLTIADGRHLHTAGLDTVIQQIAGQPAGTRILQVTGSDVVIEDLTLRGNIDTDTGEQHHGIFVQSTTSAIDDVRMGRIVGEDLRGDVVYLGGTLQYPLTDVRIESVHADNVLRNGVSVIGCDGLWVGSITCDRLGFMAFDIEPNDNPALPASPTAQACGNIRVDFVRAGVVAMAQSGASSYTGHVSFGMLDLNPAYQPDTSTTYSARNVSRGLLVRNTRSLHIESARFAGFTSAAINIIRETATADQWIERIIIDHLYIESASTADPTYDGLILNFGCRHLAINGGSVTLPSASKYLVLGLGADPQPVTLRNLECNGTLIYFGDRCLFENIRINNAAWSTQYTVRGCTNSTLSNSSIVLGRIAGTSSRLRIEKSEITCTTLFDTGAMDADVVDSTINGIYYRQQVWTRGSASAFGMGNGVTGGAAGWVWVDANSRWRSKATKPASDTDGWVAETVARRLSADVALSASTTVMLTGLDIALAASSGVFVIDYELAVDVTGGTAGLKPVFTIPANTASARFSAWGNGTTTAALVSGASTTAVTTAYATAFAAATPLTGAVIRGRLVIAMGGTAGTVSIGVVTGASAAGNVLTNSSATMSHV